MEINITYMVVILGFWQVCILELFVFGITSLRYENTTILLFRVLLALSGGYLTHLGLL